MKITTMHISITHERKPEFDDARFEALEEAFEELCPIAETAESLIDTLRKVNPSTKEVIVVGNVVMIEIQNKDKNKPCLKEVDIAGFSFMDLYTSLVAAVL